MKYLKIRSRVHDLQTMVDDDIYEQIKEYKWFVTRGKLAGKFYVWRHDYTNGWTDKTRKRVHLHRFVIGEIPAGMIVDHIDRNPLNNQRSNLRLSTYSQNNMNMEPRTNNTSGYKGVYWESRRQCWRVCINYEKKQIHVGQFKDKSQAISAYKHKAKELYGQFAI